MANYQQQIPKDKTQAETVIGQWVCAGKQMQAPHHVGWGVAHWYMRGARNFTQLNYQDGSIQVAWADEKGKLSFKYEDILTKYQTQLGRLIGMDLAPIVKQRGISLEGMRKRGVAQAALNTAFPSDKIAKMTDNLFAPLLTYGMVGLVNWVQDEDSMGIEVVMPWELLPIPAHPATATDVRGILRVRPVPKDWIKNLVITPGKKSKVYDEIEGVSVPTGNVPTKYKNGYAADYSTAAGNAFSVQMGSSGMMQSTVTAKDKTHEDVSMLVEVWTWTPDDYLADYQVYAGWGNNYKQLHTVDFTDQKVHRPIRTIRDMQVCSFYGRSYVDALIPLNTEMEYALGKMFEYVGDWDLYGYLLESTTAGVDLSMMDADDRIKRVRYEPDYTSPNPVTPVQVKQNSPGPWLAKALSFGADRADAIANQPNELLAGGAPGRVDSSAGLGSLYEMSRIPLGPTAKSIALGVSGCYKAALGMIGKLWQPDKIVDMTMLDDHLAGVKIDPQTGQFRLSENALPHPDEVEITIASEVPVSRQQQVLELREELASQMLTPMEYRIEVRKRGLDLPVGSEVEWQNYRRAMLENIVLFGDGKEPGEGVFSEYDIHAVHIMVLSAFMARPEFYAASTEVRDKFVNHLQQHNAGLGIYPDAQDYPEDAAEGALNEFEQGGGPPQ